MPGGIQLETGAVLSALHHIVTSMGVDFRRGVVEEVLQDGAHVGGVRLGSGETIVTETVVLATGAWLNQRLDDVGWKLPLLPFVSTRFVTEDVGVADTMPTLQGVDFPLWIRESEGGFTWGTTYGAAPAHRTGSGWMDFSREGRTLDELIERQRGDVERIAKVFPQLRGATNIREIQGMPVYTVDRQFFLGEIPTCRGLWVLGGDNESGVSHGPGLGRLVSELIAGSEPFCNPLPYRPDRFSPEEYPDAEAVGQTIAAAEPSFIGDAMRRPVASPYQ